MTDEMTKEEFVNEAVVEGLDQMKAEDMAAVLADQTSDIKRQMSAPEVLALDPMLEAARQRYHLIDGYFSSLATDDRIFVYQIDMNEGETFLTDGKIIRSKPSEQRARHESTRGVLLSWGLKAQDELWCQGYRLGHVVEFIEMAPWKKEVGRIYAKSEPEYLLVLRAGMIVGSVTLEQDRRAGRYRVERVRTRVTSGGEPTSMYHFQHCIRDAESGELMQVQQPVVMEDL